MDQRLPSDIQAWDRVADHRTGTPGDAATADWLASEIRKASLVPEIDWFGFQRRVLGDCSVSADGLRVEGLPLFDGGFTDGAHLQGPLQSTDAIGGIGITEFGPGPAHRGTQALQRARLANALNAIVAVAVDDFIAPGLTVLNAENYRQPFGPVVLQVETQARIWLADLQARRTPVTVVAEATLENTRAANVQTRIAGSDESLAPLVIMTPRSGWWTCTSERGGGIAIWLECIRHFSAVQPLRTVIFTANTGHELGHLGLDHYLQAHHELVAGAHAWIHLGANFAASQGGILFQASTPALMDASLAEFAAKGVAEPALTPVGQRPLGEARNIFDGGGEFISLLGRNRLFHHPDDRWPDAVDMETLTPLAHAILALADDLASA